MHERQFIVVERTDFNDHLYRPNQGFTYNEEDLREWANDRWSTPEDATLDIIARDIGHGGWMLFEHIAPTDPDL